MSDPSEAFTTAQEAALFGSTGLAVAMELDEARVLLERPTNVPIPSIVIGDDQVIGEGPTACGDESEIFSTVHIYGRDGRQVRRIAGIVRAILKDGFAITGHTVVVAEFNDMRFLTDPSGSTHAALTFRYQTVPAA